MRSIKKKTHFVTRPILLAALLGCSSHTYAVEEDPWEGFNRGVFAFNEFVDRYFLKPVAKAYDWVTPDPVDDSISNVYKNLGEVGNFVNDLLQGKFSEASHDAGRFLVNTTVGIGGLFDPATKLGLERNEEDFGQTFANWNLESGPFVMLPLFGPSTVRDALGRIPDAFTSPQRYLDHVPTRNSVYALDIVDTRADLLKLEELIQGDKYSFIRDVYLQRRAFLAADGDVEDDFTADDLEDE